MRTMNGKPLGCRIDSTQDADPICSDFKKKCDEFFKRRGMSQRGFNGDRRGGPKGSK